MNQIGLFPDPDQKLKWQVWPLDKKGRICGPPGHILARFEAGAKIAGRALFRMTRQEFSDVVANRYYPERDPAFQGYIQLVAPFEKEQDR